MDKVVISHRGLLEGPNKILENCPYQIKETLALGFEVEVDIWYVDNRFYLGHDKPIHYIDILRGDYILNNPKAWLHAKNIEALNILNKLNRHCFWHENDKYTLTSMGYVWTFPNQPVNDDCVIVLKNRYDQPPGNCYGICTDWPLDYV